MLHVHAGHMSYGPASDSYMPVPLPQVPMLTNDEIPPEQHGLVPSFVGRGKRIHPLPYSDPGKL